MIKYSIIMPFYKKRRELKATLDSFLHHYKNRKDFEVVIVEDSKSFHDIVNHKELCAIIEDYSKDLNIVDFYHSNDNGYNPAKLFNFGVKHCNGQYIILTNPECAHKDNILSGLDTEFENNKESYVVCSCQNIDIWNYNNWEDFTVRELSWYQHSKHRNARYHFCSAISRENYDKIGGFDENFSKGIGYDDDDFRDSVIDLGLDFVLRDDLLTYHINHKNSFNLPNYDEFVKINKNYYTKKKIGKNGIKIGIAIPLTDDKIPRQFHESWVKMIKPKNFIYIVPKSRGTIAEIRNQLVEQALDHGCTNIIMLDTDQTYEPDVLLKLMSHDKDVVGTVVCRRYPQVGFAPVLLRGVLGKYRNVSDEDIENMPLIEVDATGTGAIMFKTDVFLDIDYPWFESGVAENGKPFGEDIKFCSKLRDADYKIWVDTTIKIGHLATMEITYEFYKLIKDLENLRRGND